MMPTPGIEGRIFLIRGHRVLLDSDLALLYGVTTKRLNQQVRRNIDRFPADFGFQLLVKEIRILRSQIATSSWGGRRYLPWGLNDLEARYDGQFKVDFDAIRQLMAPSPGPSDRRIGFHPDR